VNERRAPFRLVVSPGKGEDAVVGYLEDDKGNTLVEFESSVRETNDQGKKLRKQAREWAASFEKNNTQQPAQWLQLHECGARCFMSIFGDRADDVQASLAAAGEDIRIWLKQKSSKVLMPWGMLCNPADVPQRGLAPRPHSLWGNKYNLTISLEECGRSVRRKRDAWSFAPVLCHPTYAQGIKDLSNAAVPLAEMVKSKCLGLPKLDQPARTFSNCFLYVHAHAEEGELLFERADRSRTKERILPTELIRSLVSNDGAAVAVLNACETVQSVMSLGASLMLSSNNREVASIATEIEVHQGFAMQFGLELIDRCVQRGESMIDAMVAMRNKHYPLSIIYSHYCKADSAVDPPLSLVDTAIAEAYRKSTEKINFSDTFKCEAVL